MLYIIVEYLCYYLVEAFDLVLSDLNSLMAN